MRPALLVTVLWATAAIGQSTRVLHFTKTSGFDHNTRTASAAMFQSIAALLDIQVDDDATGDPFTDPATLAQYGAIVFANTSGDAILDAQQRANFEQWVANGGHVMGIHAATDTYRHSNANGTNTGAWDFFPELIGASVQQNPNHVSGTPLYAMAHMMDHEMIMILPDPWEKNEEYYYWEGGYYDPTNVELLRVEETIGPNGLVNSYDAPRPMCWYRELPSGSRVFYTALGHAPENYTDDVLFLIHIQYGLMWMLGIDFAGVGEPGLGNFSLGPNPASAWIDATDLKPGTLVLMHDEAGRLIGAQTARGSNMRVDVSSLPNGIYSIRSDAHVRRVVVLH